MNIYLIPFQYYFKVFTCYRNAPEFRAAFTSTLVYLVSIYGALFWLSTNGFAAEVFWLAIVPMLVTLFLLIMFFDYIPHHPHNVLGEFQNTRIYPGKFLNVLLLGQNYHLIHHLYPRLPWYCYQSVYGELKMYLKEKAAPVEYVSHKKQPGILQSNHTSGLFLGNNRIHAILRVTTKQQLSSDAVEITFRLPKQTSLNFHPGQYITVSKWLNGKHTTRCYSLCSMPKDPHLTIGVKRVTGGAMSNFIVDELTQGDELVVQGPFGEFYLPEVKASFAPPLFLVAGGSGITPVLSILKSALAVNPQQKVFLLYCCKTRHDILFCEELNCLTTKYENQLRIQYWLSQDSTVSNHLDASSFDEILNAQCLQLGNKEERQYFLCGPTGLLALVSSQLKRRGVSGKNIYIEEFVRLAARPEGQVHQIQIKNAHGNVVTFQAAENQTVLEAAELADVNIPHACGQGICGSCKVKVVKGDFDGRKTTSGITDDEAKQGCALACQMKPTSNLELRYQALE